MKQKDIQSILKKHYPEYDISIYTNHDGLSFKLNFIKKLDIPKIGGRSTSHTTKIRKIILNLFPYYSENLDCYNDKRKNHRRLKFSAIKLNKQQLSLLNKQLKRLNAVATMEEVSVYPIHFDYVKRLVIRYK